ncbi:MAG: 5'-3' exonuclease [Geodermatophilaceae bacterium]|nr:5'-3' exonuclease [Geodermatophilaceae bacterium]
MLLDSASLYFRTFYGVPDTVVSPDGIPVNAVRGFLDAIAALVRARRPTELVACWDDDWRPAFRVEAIATYKTHRVVDADPELGDTPDGLGHQVPIIVDMLEAAGICRLGSPGFEADDVIGTLATRASGGVEVVTGDRDLFQLVRDDQPIRVVYTAKGLSNLETVDEAWITAKYGIPGRAYADFAVLRGDPSDGLPGVRGIGDKTAAALILAYGSVDAIIDAARGRATPTGALTAGVLRKMVAAVDYLAVAPQVVRVRRDCPLPDVPATLPAVPEDPERLADLATRWGLQSAVNRLREALSWP